MGVPIQHLTLEIGPFEILFHVKDFKELYYIRISDSLFDFNVFFSTINFVIIVSFFFSIMMFKNESIRICFDVY